MVKPPKYEKLLTKVLNGKTYHWCPNHKAWTKHTPGQCHMKSKSRKERQGKPKASKDANKKDRGAGLLFACTFATIMADAVRDKKSSDSK
eukprot:5288845-Ditylum_brightwellii.AAC.2